MKKHYFVKFSKPNHLELHMHKCLSKNRKELYFSLSHNNNNKKICVFSQDMEIKDGKLLKSGVSEGYTETSAGEPAMKQTL